LLPESLATVTEVQPKKRMGRGGKLNVNIDDVKLVSGEKAALRAIKDAKGGGHVGAMTGAMVATSIVFFPAAPFFLFMHGKEMSIPKGTEITAYVNGNMHLDARNFVPGATLANAKTRVRGKENASQIGIYLSQEITVIAQYALRPFASTQIFPKEISEKKGNSVVESRGPQPTRASQ